MQGFRNRWNIIEFCLNDLEKFDKNDLVSVQHNALFINLCEK